MIHAIDMTSYMTVKECAAQAEVSEGTIRRWMDEKRFGWMRKNLRDRLIDKNEFDAFMKMLRAPVVRAASKTGSGPASAFVPPGIVVVGGDEYRHLFDAPIDAADGLGPHVSVYYSSRCGDAVFRDADHGGVVELPGERGDELRRQAARADAAAAAGGPEGFDRSGGFGGFDRSGSLGRLDREDREYHFAKESGE